MRDFFKYLKTREPKAYLEMNENFDITYWNDIFSWFKWEDGFELSNSDTFKFKGKVNYAESLLQNKRKDLLVIYSKNKRYQYSAQEIIEESLKYINIYECNNLKNGDSILILLKNKRESFFYAFAALLTGLQFGFLYHNLTKEQIRTMSKEANSKLIVTEDDLLSKLPKNSNILNIKNNENKKTKSLIPSQDCTAAAVFFLTSGTTSTPKIINSGTIGTWASITFQCKLTFGDTQGDFTLWNPLDFAWGASFLLGVMGPLFGGNNKLILDDRLPLLRNHKELNKVFEDEKVTSMIGVPAFFKETQNVKLKIDRLLVTGERLSLDEFKNIKTSTTEDTIIVNAYGQVEMSSLILTNLPYKMKDTTFDQFTPVPGIQLDIQKGELLIKNNYPSFFKGIGNNKIAFNSYWTKNKSHFKTKDLAGKEGSHFKLLGRADGLIKINGRFVDTNLISKSLIDNDLVSDALIVYSKEKRLYELFIKNKKTNLSTITKFIVSTFGKYALPKIREISEFPRTESGKKSPKLLISKYCK